MSDPDQSSHWQFLVNILGAKPKDEAAAAKPELESAKDVSGEGEAKPAEAPGVPNPPLPGKTEKRSRKSSTTLREKLTHWSNVLKSVGVEPPPMDLTIPEEEAEAAEEPKIVESIPSPFASTPPSALGGTPDELAATTDPLKDWPHKPAAGTPPAGQDRGRAGQSGRERGRERRTEPKKERDRERERSHVRERGAERTPEREETAEGQGERRGRRERRRRGDRGRAYEAEREEIRPAPDELAESLFDEEELSDVELASSDAEEAAPAEDESYERGAEKRGRRRRRGRRGRRDREGTAEAGAESGREIRPRPDDEVVPDEIDISAERPARIATPFESGEVEFDETDDETIAEPETGEGPYEREERHGGRRRRRRSRGGRGAEAESRRAPEPTPTRRFEEDEELEDEDEVIEPLDDELEPSEAEDQELDEEGEDVHVRPVRSSVPSWHDAIGDIIARNMATRHKSGGGGSGYASGGRRGRGRGGRRSGPRDRS